MPELPEVETIVRDLRKTILDIEISKVEIILPRIVHSKNFKKILTGNRFTAIERVGKMLVFSLGCGDYMIVHLKMTGQLVYCRGKRVVAGGHSERRDDPEKMPNKWTRVIFTFSDQSKLYFNDLRTFGYLKIVDRSGLDKAASGYGLEPFSPEFNWSNFKKIFNNRKTSVKALLLNQKLLSGLGNIYVDEVLFAAGIRPDRRVSGLSEKELKRIYKNINPILTQAIKARGTTFSDFVDANGKSGRMSRKLQVYGRTGKKCHKCGNMIKKMKVAGRGTHYCGTCQS